MQQTSPRAPIAVGPNQPSSLSHLQEAIEHAAHLLPAQGPITVFVHHNTLHAFEDLPFDEAVKKGARIFGCHPYLKEDRYRQELGRGRIRFADLREVLEEDLGERGGEKIVGSCSRLDLRLAMLQFPLQHGPAEELRWFVAEKDALRRFRSEACSAVRERLIAETRRWVMRDLRGGPADTSSRTGPRQVPGLAGLLDRFGESSIESWSEANWEAFTLQALWQVCCDGAAGVPPFTPPPLLPVRHRDLLLLATGQDADLPVHELLIRFCAAFLDQGLAHWQLPNRDEGFFRAFCALYRRPGGPPEPWRRGLAGELGRLADAGIGPLQVIHQSLDVLGVGPDEWDDFLSATLLALRGWAGMVRQVEVRGDRVVHPAPPGSLVEFLAVRLVLDRWALTYTAREALGFTGPLRELRDAARARVHPSTSPGVEQRAFPVFQLAQVIGWTPEELYRLEGRQWQALLAEIETFSGLERRRTFHLAYERRFCTQALDAIALHVSSEIRGQRSEVRDQKSETGNQPGLSDLRPLTSDLCTTTSDLRPRFQAMFCIDEREESLRRHVEELAPDAQTFGLAGFFFLPMYYRGVTDAHFVPLCPAVLRPQHWVVEQVVEDLQEDHHRRARTRRALGMASHRFHVGSRTFALGALLATAVGVLATAPLVARTLFPRLTAQLRRRLGHFVQVPRRTRLQLERTEPTPGPEGGQVGFTLDEMTAIAERVLRDTGLTSGFARVVLVLGHGSTSMNNPHESAYDCGACGGARGGPNARALAQILNDPRIRQRLSSRGIAIEPETVFVGGLHNTSNDTVTFFDLDVVPPTHRDDLAAVRAIIEQACDRDAHERCRRFVSAPLTLSFETARQHVEGRAEDLAQVRPECGHATNALSIVGRRETTRGLFLDRRAFLTSYDPTQDDSDGTILTRILQAVFPVCAGINLEYYFSSVDNPGWGCGTKLPHNITGLLGVMDGSASDLRTGLPRQMVEIHEPVRLLNVIETTPELMLRIIDQDASIGRLCRNGWVRLAVLHPHTRALSVYRDGRFVENRPQATRLPGAASSADWYRGWRDHLEFAEIRSYE
jgi:uncharacterized protein YbcC (UPF0753/DUF2309 family)